MTRKLKCECGKHSCRICYQRAHYYRLLDEAGLDRNEPRKYGSRSFQRKMALYKARESLKIQIEKETLERRAKLSKSYTRSRRMVAMRKSAARRRAAGLKMTEPICFCGQCVLCQDRDRKRRFRQQRRTDTFYWQDMEPPPSIFDQELASQTKRASGRLVTR